MTKDGLQGAAVNPALHATAVDPLLSCLVFLTAHFGRSKSAEALRAGLAYDERGMGPGIFCEAAERLGLKTQIVKRGAIAKVSPHALPVVVVLEKGQACVLLSMNTESGKARIFLPETGAEKDVALSSLEKNFSGYVIYIHPRAEFTDPNAPHRFDSDRHWFWGPFLDNSDIYSKVLISAVLINLFGLTSSIFVMTFYNRVIPNNALETGWVLSIGAITVFIFDFILRTLRGYFIDFAGRRVDVIAARRIYDHLLNMKLSSRPASSGVFASMLREFDSVREFFNSASVTAMVDLPFCFFFLFVIGMLGGPIAVLLTVLVILVIAVGALLQIPLQAQVRKTIHTAESKHGLLVETIQGLETIKAVGADGRLRARYGDLVAEAADLSQGSRFISALGVNIAAFLQQSATVFIVLMGMYLVQDQSITMGALIACVLLGGRAIAPIGQVANLMSRYHQSRSALKTLDEFMAKPVERPAHAPFLHRPSLNGKIAFDSVSFCYPGTDRKTLQDVSFTFNPGEKVGLIGRVGSGKSTIARMILGLYDPAEGALLADDTDYRQIDPADLRRNIAYIAQDIVLFRGTVRENIAIARPQASEDEILAASKSSGVHEFIARHPMGYDAPVGEGGNGLSGGQRQAVALARAMLMDPSIFVCDEPTNAMDMQAEESFVRHIREQVKDKTFILITHRQHLLALVDRLILIDQGRIVADGPKDKVIEALSRGGAKS
ncbi:MAG: type I secretion system permease/ATPase [Micavibrio sp.]